MEMTKSETIYLKAIYDLSKKGEIRVTKIADYLNYSKPSVIRALKNLEELGLINYKKEITLTEKGITYSKNITNRDNVLFKFLTKILNIDEETALIDAANMKDNISCYTIMELEKYICNILGENIKNDKDFCICEFESCETCKR